jgi:hypothetical protein
MASKYSSIDNSPSKLKYSFPKAERFPKISIYGAMSIYNLPSVRNKRSTTMGYGGRYNFAPKNTEATPACYDFNYGVESTQPNPPKYSFGLGRENIKDNTLDRSSPGPGKYYSPLKTIGRDCPKYSMKGKYKSLLFKRTDSPGPAAYDPQTHINEKGVFGIAGYKNVKSYDFSKGVKDRFKYNVERTPGPAEYNLNKSMFGNIYDSRFKSTHGIHMVFRHNIKERDNYPGPGSYERFGDFYKYNDKTSDDSFLSKKNKSKSKSKSKEKDIYKTPMKSKQDDSIENNKEENKIEENNEEENKEEYKDEIKEKNKDENLNENKNEEQ